MYSVSSISTGKSRSSIISKYVVCTLVNLLVLSKDVCCIRSSLIGVLLVEWLGTLSRLGKSSITGDNARRCITDFTLYFLPDIFLAFALIILRVFPDVGVTLIAPPFLGALLALA